MATSPYGCQHCGHEQRTHFTRWADGVGMHTWAEPTQQLIKERQLARREARTTK